MIQESLESKKGTLFMLTNNIGCNSDTPPRSLEILASADLLVFEEDRPARAALKQAGLTRHYLKFSEHGQVETLKEVRKTLQAGLDVAYMSDQGSPTLADPGSKLVEVAYDIAARVKVVPGPSSIIAALSAFPRNLQSFHFAGFLSKDTASRNIQLKALKARNETLIILDTPYRLQALLASCKEIFGGKHKALLALDISGENEDYLFAPLARLYDLAENISKLNFVLVVE